MIVNSDDDNGGKNILMDVVPRYPGYTDVSFRVASIEETVRLLKPINFGGEIAVFVRDPDGNVVELAEIVR